MAKKKAGRGWRATVIAIVCCGVAAMLGLVLLLFGSVTGIEFSPTHFETRQFSVREIPWLQTQITPIRRVNSQSATARYLIAQSLIQPTKGVPSDWHLVQLSRGGFEVSDSDAKLLTDQLDLYVYTATSSSSATSFWHQWSIDEPEKAKILWPIIQRLAIRELYILMPRLFSLAVDSKDKQTLQTSIDDYLRSSYAELITEMRDANRHQLADDLLAEAIADYPDDAKLQGL
jgi:hypothetical protein